MSRHSEAVVLYLILKLEVHKDKGAVWQVEAGGPAIQAPVLWGFSTKGVLALVDLGEDMNLGTLLCSLRLGGKPLA